jgi:hypothetical protein
MQKEVNATRRSESGIGACRFFLSETPFDFGFITLLKGAAGGGTPCAAALARIPAALFDPDTSGLSIEQLNHGPVKVEVADR